MRFDQRLLLLQLFVLGQRALFVAAAAFSPVTRIRNGLRFDESRTAIGPPPTNTKLEAAVSSTTPSATGNIHHHSSQDTLHHHVDGLNHPHNHQSSIVPPVARKSSFHLHRFDRTASLVRHVDQPCILTIDSVCYNVTAWAKSHPGGAAILEKYHNRDATKAFHTVHHSAQAKAMLQNFIVQEEEQGVKIQGANSIPTNHVEIADDNNKASMSSPSSTLSPGKALQSRHSVPRWRAKLFTKEDPLGVHKTLGVFCLLNFAFRYFQMFFTDPSAGLGMRLGRGPSWIPVACLVPHGLLSLSSLIFHTVPRDRVVGQPMIWQEYRLHNIGFGVRSVLTAAMCATAMHCGHNNSYNNLPMLRQWAVGATCAICMAALVVADVATQNLRPNQYDSTTATMPYWEGCGVETQKRFKSFYAYCQFMATLGCLTVTNPAFPLAILLAIQLASLFMTLVRKGLMSTRAYHLGYTATLLAPYLVAFRSSVYMKSPEMLFLFALGGILYQLRRQGVNKYALWLPVMVARIAVGDRFLTYDIW